MAELLYPELSYVVVGAAMEVHRVLGSGYLEAVYQAALAQELALRGVRYEQQKRISVGYKGAVVGEYQADFVVDECIILELKAVAALNGSHEAQALNYLAATGLKLAILLNFGAESLQQRRVINRNRKGQTHNVEV
jgi:GxxExxY protein